MIFINLTAKQKNDIINECINTKKKFNTIADSYNIKIETLYEIINEYCRENNYKAFIRTRAGGVFETKDGRIIKIEENKSVVIKKIQKNNKKKNYKLQNLKNIEEIEDWAEEKGRKPRSQIR